VIGRLPAAPSRDELLLLAALLVLGTAIRVWVGFTNYGWKFDIDSAYIVERLLATHPLHVYSSFRYPYPGGFLPVIYLARALALGTGVAFSSAFKLPSILADAGIAATVWWGLARRGVEPHLRLLGAALISLGPLMILISGYHGQIDASAILPALLAVVLWQRGGERRAWQAGLLVGLGASIIPSPSLSRSRCCRPPVRVAKPRYCSAAHSRYRSSRWLRSWPRTVTTRSRR
jgi:hypothetical protein